LTLFKKIRATKEPIIFHIFCDFFSDDTDRPSFQQLRAKKHFKICHKAYKTVKKTKYLIISSLWKFRSEKLKNCGRNSTSPVWIGKGKNALMFRFLKSGHIASVVSNLFLKNLAQKFGQNQEIVQIITFLHYDFKWILEKYVLNFCTLYNLNRSIILIVA